MHADLASCIAAHASRGPRYTSYPPATEFGPLSVDRITREVAAIRTSSLPISLYAHIPFCRSLCAYCGCNVIPTRDASRADAYLDYLVTELALVARGEMTAPVVEIALGGGSPNFLSPTQLQTLVTAMDRLFTVHPDARRSIELDPRSTTAAQTETLGALRFTSISLGVQDFAAPVQDAIRRHQTVPQTKWLVDRARDVGMTDINIDMVYGLPLQTESSFAATVDAVIELAPDRVALFGYAHLPDKLPHQRIVERAGRVLDAYERATLLVRAIARFEAAGYVHIGLDHFARADSTLAAAARQHRITRTFQGYVERRADTILGVGVSAISSTPQAYWQNHGDLAHWQADIAATRLPVARGYALDADDCARREVISRLMCDGEVDLSALGETHGIDAEMYFARELRDLGELDGLASWDGDLHRIETSSLGKLLVRNVCMVFDRYLRDRGPARFSPTI